MAKNASARLDNLPNEILDGIAAQLDRSTLYALTLVCKKTAASATIALYSTYANVDPPSVAPFSLFLRTLCEVPRLAALVTTVKVRGWRSEYEVANGVAWRGVEPLKNTDEVMPQRSKPMLASANKSLNAAQNKFDLFHRAAVRAGLVKPGSHSTAPLKSTLDQDRLLRNDEDFVRLLKHDVEDAHFILLLALLPNLDCVGVSGLSVYSTLDWYTFLSRSKGALQKVTSLFIHGSQPREHEPILQTSMQVLDILPQLQILCISNMSVQGHRYTVASLPTKAIRTLWFSRCAICHRLLAKIFANQKPETLVYLPRHREIQTIHSAATLNENQITTALGEAKNSIQKLCLYPNGPSPHQRTAEYASLKYLHMPHITMLPQNSTSTAPADINRALRYALPPTLQTLTLHRCYIDRPMEPIVQQLVELKTAGRLPHIASLSLMFDESLSIMGSAAWVIVVFIEERLRKAVEGSGIELHIELGNYGGAIGA
ncbi:hypothetical protein C7974DRAFT_447583 [Boeremia exigua]|uniref:uncharacterized protein n=1 Tax=Boeremia exigua TaxID=749465 RepID=UPI001E8E0748|nr:uncharacterized protein C7974DRAFT_447583 [Boeremia exigua]KAH6642790.1 hypothetical protein C7974DRAFT_447583 [Boeremia exigua]